jgi:hypothetical protein
VLRLLWRRFALFLVRWEALAVDFSSEMGGGELGRAKMQRQNEWPT